MQTQIYDKSYTADSGLASATGPSGSTTNQYLCVVQGAEDGGVAMPGAANAAHFMGITQTSQTNASSPISVRKLGVSLAWSNGAISAGNHVGIASANGDVTDIESAIDAAPGTAKAWQAIGIAETSATGSGQLIEVFICPSVVSVAVS
ncbi:MAG: hypothetical protein KGL39_11445 [Patescibacteria group bacterium]|nr:hypothetical protein [Patescibacteria group bacterium]